MNEPNDINDLGILLVNGGWRVRLTSPRGFRGLVLGIIGIFTIITFDVITFGIFGDFGGIVKPNPQRDLHSPSFYIVTFGFIFMSILVIMSIHPSIRFQLYTDGISVDKWCFSKPPRKIRRTFDDLKQLKIVCSYPPPYWILSFIWFDGTRVSVNSYELVLPPVKEWIDKLNIPREKIDWFSYDSKDMIEGFTKTSENTEKPTIKEFLDGF